MIETTAAPSPRVAVPHAEAAPTVSIVIVTFGTGPIVLEVLAAIVAHTPLPYEVIVVDNAPPEHLVRTASLLAAQTSGVTLLSVDRNLGFAEANNLGVEQARASTICLLNPDVIVTPGWLGPLVAALDDPEVGIAAPVLVDPDGTLQEAGQLLYDDGCTAAIGGPEVCPGDWSQAFSRDVDYASAACWVLRREEFLALGGFDGRYHPAYFEDVDYALRVEENGKRTRLVAAVQVVHHHGQGSTADRSTIAVRSQEAFRSTWTARLVEQPGRPRSVAESIRNRDRLAAASLGWAVPATGTTVASRRAALEDARRAALQRPRDRVTFATDDAGGLDLDSARADGVEIVVGSADAITSARPRTSWQDVGPSAHLAARSTGLRWPVLLSVAAVVVLGVVVRWVLFGTPAAVINADEAYTRIETYEILRGQFPIVLGGTVYTFPVEAYLYTPFTYLFRGANVVPLKLLSTLSWLLTALTLYYVGGRLVSRRAGLIAATLCWVTPGALLVLSITAYPAYASGMLVVSLAFLVATIVLDTPPPGPSRRLLVLFGALAGFAFWLHPMFLAVMVPMVTVVLWTARRRLEAWLGVIGGGVLGCSPLLLWNAVNGWPSLETPVKVPGTYSERLRTFAVDLMPRAFGLRDGGLSWYHEFWGPVLYLALLVAIAFGLWTIARGSASRGRFVLFAVLGSVFFLMALLRNLIYANDGRYAMISFPFVLVALAAGIDRLAGVRPPWRPIGALAVVVVIWIVGFVRPNAQPFLDARGVDPNAQLDEIVDVLDERGINRIYGSYWAVLPVDFAGDNRIVSAVFPFWPIRFPDRQRVVGATPAEDVAVIFMTEDEDPSNLLMPVEGYERIVIGDRVVYLPLGSNSAPSVAG